MSAIVFTIANQKGGVGKTATAVNMAAGLAQRKIPTLLIDLDPQANATSTLGLEKSPGGSVYGPMLGEGSFAEKVVPTGRDNLWLIPSEVDLAALEMELMQQEGYLMRLREKLKPMRKEGEFRAIILDCPPALGMLSMNALAAAHYLIITLQCEYLALEGLGEILRVRDQLREAKVNPDLELGGILMTMFDIRTNLSRQVVSEVQKHFPKEIFKAVIPRSIRLGEAPSHGQTIFEYDALSSGAVAYGNFAKEVAKRFELKKK